VRLSYGGVFSALEVACVDGSSFVFKFESEEAQQEASKKLVRMSRPRSPGKTRTTRLQYHQTLNPVNVLAVTKLAQKWASLQLTSLQYLAQLNSLAGRTFHDPNRHPIFPNVLKSFSSAKPESLDFGQAKQSHSLLSGTPR